MPITNEREYRSMQVRVKESETESDEKVVEGYFTTFEEPYLLGSYRTWDNTDVEVWEVVDTDAFKDTDMSDVIMQYDHEGHVYARISNGTLRLEDDDHGKKIIAYLGGTEDGRKLYEEIKGGYTTKMSFGFSVSEWEEEQRTGPDGKLEVVDVVKKIKKLWDVSAVSLPANDSTVISARNRFNAEVEKRMAEVKEEESSKAEEEKRAAKEKELKERERLSLELSFSL